MNLPGALLSPPADFYLTLDVPNPGKPPKRRIWTWTSKSSEALIADSEKRVLWGWMNYAHFRKLIVQSNVLDGPLLETENLLRHEHTEYMDRLDAIRELEKSAMAKKSESYRTAARCLADKGYMYQKRSKVFTDSALHEILARAGGRASYPY